jgi:hypothetical protein
MGRYWAGRQPELRRDKRLSPGLKVLILLALVGCVVLVMVRAGVSYLLER